MALTAILFLLSIDLLWTPVRGVAMPLADIVRELSYHQHRGSWFRDRCSYFQRIYVERYKDKEQDGKYGDRFVRRLSVAEVSADDKGEVKARLLSDTDNDLEPKRVKDSSRVVWGAPAFLELIFFPLYPEKVQFYQITDLGTTMLHGEEVRILRLDPKRGLKEPLIEGLFYLDPNDGRPRRLQVTRLHNFEELDKKLNDLEDFEADITYRTLPNQVTTPYKVFAEGDSRVIRHKGFFKIRFEEWGYRPNPFYPDVNSWFDKMQDFQEEAHDDPPPDFMEEQKIKVTDIKEN
jgi:hypothetical protein